MDRSKLRKIIFSNREEKLWLENFLHPLIKNTILNQLKEVSSPYCIIEIPLLYNKQNFSYLNRVLLVLAPEQIQMQRLCQRDHCSSAEVAAILATQLANLERQKIADDIIVNDRSLAELEKKVQDLHEYYLSLI